MGAFVSYFFSGFILGKIPFPLSPSFRLMLQVLRRPRVSDRAVGGRGRALIQQYGPGCPSWRVMADTSGVQNAYQPRLTSDALFRLSRLERVRPVGTAMHVRLYRCDPGRPVSAVFSWRRAERSTQKPPHLRGAAFAAPRQRPLVELPRAPLTRHAPARQRGVDLPALDVTYFTSLSYYILLLFGLRGVLTLIFRDATIDETQMYRQQMGMGGGGGGPMGAMANPDPNKAFEAERAALELVRPRAGPAPAPAAAPGSAGPASSPARSSGPQSLTAPVLAPGPSASTHALLCPSRHCHSVLHHQSSPDHVQPVPELHCALVRVCFGKKQRCADAACGCGGATRTGRLLSCSVGCGAACRPSTSGSWTASRLRRQTR
jgi:hypothetical protein